MEIVFDLYWVIQHPQHLRQILKASFNYHGLVERLNLNQLLIKISWDFLSVDNIPYLFFN